jgi:type IV pilus assembly protein PilW
MTLANFPMHQRGMSLVELMVSVAIGLLITLAISTLFLNTNRSNKENNDTASMQENARFAMESIASDIRHAGFFGNVQNSADIDPNGVTMPPGTDCSSMATGTPYMLDFSNSQQLIGYSTGLSNSALTTLIAPCTIATAVTLPAADNTILAIKRVSSSSRTYDTFHTMPVSKADGGGKEAGRIFVHSTGSVARLGNGSSEPFTQPSTQIWEYMPRFYYVTHTIVTEGGRNVYKQTLYRSTYGIETEGEWLNEPLAEGIERFHMEFGVDSDDDGTPNYFSDVPADIDFNGVVSARVHVLARTTNVDINYNDTNSYILGSITVTPSTDPNNPDPNKARYHRQVYSTTVTIPNLRRRHTLN